MTPAELRAAIDAATSDEALRRVVQDWAARVREPNDDDHPGLASELVPLARHPSEVVRRALALVCDRLPGTFFDEVHATLAGDHAHFVCVAARQAHERRAKQRLQGERADHMEEVSAALGAELETKYGRGARQLAQRLAKREVRHLLERLNHEVTKIEDSVALVIDAMTSELAKPDASPAALRAQLTTLRERLAFQRSLFLRARDYARPIRAQFASESVAAIVVEARSQLADRLRDRAGRLDLTLDVPASMEMHADRHALLQALQSLLQNAVEAYPPDAQRLTVRVTARALHRGTQIELRIADQGMGMTEERRAALFVPFRTGKPGGTGVGLLMARKMVEDVHGGTLTVDSARGAGTTIVLTMPARQTAARGRE